MGNLSPTGLWSRTEYAPQGLGVTLHTFAPKNGADPAVVKIEESINKSMGGVVRKAKINFAPELRVGKQQEASAAQAPHRPETRLSGGSSSLSAEETGGACYSPLMQGRDNDSLLFAQIGSSPGVRRRLLGEEAMDLDHGTTVLLVVEDTSREPSVRSVQEMGRLRRREH